MPDVEYVETTMVAINVGGALIPTLVSSYLLWKIPSVILYTLVGVAVVHALERTVQQERRLCTQEGIGGLLVAVTCNRELACALNK
ncbi:MAG: DUF1614 domain-containing protein [Candidatus Bathyarchaeia archaeon]